jgi:ABC-type transport system involved in multi-copper enzyme maturation permease subunit
MKFLKIFRFEFTYQLRSISIRLYFIAVLCFSFLVVTENFSYDAREGYYLLNAPIVIATVSVLCVVHWLLAGASVAGDAAARDVQTRMHFLTYPTSASKAAYLGGRFFAALVLNVLTMLAIPMGILFALYFSGIEAEIMGPFRLASYLTAFFNIIIPNVFTATTIQFSLAAISRRTMAGYLGGLILFVAVYLFWMVLDNKGEWGNLADPMSFKYIMNHQNDWSPLERNTRLFVLEGSFLINRLLWFGVSVGILTFTYFRFRFALPETSRKHKAVKDFKSVIAVREKLSWSAAGVLPQIRGTYGLTTSIYQLRTLTYVAFLKIVKSRVGLPLLAVLALMMGLAATGDGNLKARGVPLIPRTDQVLHYLTAPLTEPKFFWIIITLLTIYYAGELVWRERETGLNAIADAAPVSEWVLFLSKFLSLGGIMVLWLLCVMITGIILQVSIGGASIEVGLYLQALFGLQLVDCLLFALLVLLLHVLINQKFVAHLVAVLAYGAILFASKLGIEHKLLIFGASPEWSYTDMAGFGISLAPWLWFKLYWVAWAILLAVVATLLWVRSREVSFASRLRLARYRFTGPTRPIAATALGGILLSAGFVLYNTHILNDYTTTSDEMEKRAMYEERYGLYRNRPQPRLTKTDLNVEIYPKQRMVEIRGIYHLLNNGTVAIDSIHLSTGAGVQTNDVAFDRPANRVNIDEKLNYQIYRLAEPLQPGDSLQLSFEVRHTAHGFTNNGADAAVIGNGTNFKNHEWLPAIGYQSYRELHETGQRKTYKLPTKPETPSLYDLKARRDSQFSEPISFEAVVGTDTGQTAVAPGSLIGAWIKGGRRYFHYATAAPIRNEYSIFSANYAVHEKQWKDIIIQIYYDPAQPENVERMTQSVQASLAYYSQQFGPYPYPYIRFVSYPGYGFGNHSTTGTITAEECFFLLNPKDDPRGFDLVTAVVAHEMGHQWWGGQLTPARVEGAGFLSESLAWYVAMGVIENKYGSEHLQKLLSFLLEENENPRSRAALPLLQANNWYQYYRKGPFVMHALSQYIGRDRINGVLRKLLEKHRPGALPLPTTLDLYQELQAVTPDSLRYLLQDLFEKNTFWKLETKDATAKKTKAGNWEVTLNLQADKMVVDSIGAETKLPMKDWVEVGVFAPAERGKLTGRQVYLRKHLIKSGLQTITVIVPQKPARAGIDPNHLLIDWEMNNNSKEVKAGN